MLVFGALFVLMIVIGLLTSPGARDTTSPAAARESAVEPATLVRELEPEKLQASVLVAAYERNEIAADQQFKGKMFEIEGVVENGGLFGLPARLHAGRDHRLAVKLWIRRSASARPSFETRSSHQRNARA